MVLMLRLISGLLIIFLCAVDATEVTTTDPQNPNTNRKYEETTTEPLALKYNTYTPLKLKRITDEDVENIVKPYKFAKENVKNITSLKLKKSESYHSTKSPNNRTNAGRSVDIDVDKFSAPVDHNAVYTSPDSKEYGKEEISFTSFGNTQDAGSFESLGLLTTPETPLFDKKFKETVESVNKNLEIIPDPIWENSTNNKNYSSDNYIDGQEENEEESKLKYDLFESTTRNNQEPGRRTFERIEETRTSINNVNKYNVSTSYESKSPKEESNELHKEAVKNLPNDDTANEIKQNPSLIRNTSPVSILQSMRKTTSLEKTDPAVISNRIEGEPTTIPSSTIPLFTNKPTTPSRGSIKFSDYNKVNLKTVSSSPENKPVEQTVEENQVVPVQVTAPTRETTSATTPKKFDSESITTIKTKSIVLNNHSILPDQKQSTTVYIFVQPEDIKDFTTIRNEIDDVQKTSFASTPRTFQPVPTTLKATTETTMTTVSDEDERTTAVTSVPRGFSLPTTTERIPTTVSPLEEVEDDASTKTEDLTTTTTESETPTAINIDVFKSITSTTESSEETSGTTTVITETTAEIDYKSTVSSKHETSTIPLRTTTMLGEVTTVLPEITTVLDETTTVIPEITTSSLESTTVVSESTAEPAVTTTSAARSSKNIKIFETTEVLSTQTFESTTLKTENSSNVVTNSIEYSAVTTETNEVSTSKDLDLTTEMITEVSTMKNQKAQPINEEQTSEPITKIIFHTTPTKTLLENTTSEGKQVKESKTTPSTSFDFVHINTIDKNHTTLTPDELKPNEIYTTPILPSAADEKLSSTSESSSDETTSSGLDGPSSSSGTVVAIIISCVGGVCLIALACLLIVMRNRQNRFNYGQRCRPVSLDDYSVDNVSVFNSVRRKAALRGSKTSYGNPAFEDPVCLSHPLNFPAISKFAANEEDVTAEFKDIPQIVARMSELPEGCETKNRYANVIPLPESRVFLNHIEGYQNSDYINANFVTGPKNIRKYYIACQAPMSNTVDDFWRMIWEQQCKVILMLTNLYESGIEKCVDYLPPSEVLDCHRLFGDYQVTLKKREVKEKYIISNIQLKNMVSNSWREVTHFWYMGWPEKGVPTEANSIIAFLIEARSFMKSATIDKNLIKGSGDMNGTPEVNPVVVHCSPGTGRTGAVITCDIAIRDFEQTRQVDIPKIVYKIRRDRAGAVQTKEQYAFIYKVIDFYATKLAGGNLESI